MPWIIFLFLGTELKASLKDSGYYESTSTLRALWEVIGCYGLAYGAWGSEVS